MSIAIALALVAALIANVPAASPERPGSALPAMIIRVSASPSISPKTIARTIEEATGIWRELGFTFDWRGGPREVAPYMHSTEAGPYAPSTLRVVISEEEGLKRAKDTPLGWITFDDQNSPEQVIHISYGNALSLLALSRPVVGPIDKMPTLERDIRLSRAMGRALAHELGHYLLASKSHTASGLMQATRSAVEFFGPDRVHFELDPVQQEAVAARFAKGRVLASR